MACLCQICNVHLAVFVRQEPTLGYPRKCWAFASDFFSIDVQSYGIASRPSQSRHPRCIISWKLFRERDFFIFIVSRIFLNSWTSCNCFDHYKWGFIARFNQTSFWLSVLFTLDRNYYFTGGPLENQLLLKGNPSEMDLIFAEHFVKVFNGDWTFLGPV